MYIQKLARGKKNINTGEDLCSQITASIGLKSFTRSVKMCGMKLKWKAWQCYRQTIYHVYIDMDLKCYYIAIVYRNSLIRWRFRVKIIPRYRIQYNFIGWVVHTMNLYIQSYIHLIRMERKLLQRFVCIICVITNSSLFVPFGVIFVLLATTIYIRFFPLVFNTNEHNEFTCWRGKSEKWAIN